FRSQVVLPALHRGDLNSGNRLRVWSAGCSTGEEPYTIAVVLKRELHDLDRHNVRVLATDIDTEVLAKAARRQYPAAALSDVPLSYRNLLTSSPPTEPAEPLRINESLRELIVFRRLNLLAPWPFQGLFDAIFCRNVMIYFDGPTKATLIDRFMQQ